MKEKTRKKFKNIKKTINGFIRDEDGFVTKDKLLKIGLGTVASVGILSSVSECYAERMTLTRGSLTTHTNLNMHQNGFNCTAVAGTNCQRCDLVNIPGGIHSNHVSKALVGHGDGCISKGCAEFDYCGDKKWNNTCTVAQVSS